MPDRRKINWDGTHVRLVALLRHKLYPQHYKQAYHDTVRFTHDGEYGDRTDPIEKFRQRYAEHHHEDVAVCPGGYLVLRQWFTDRSQFNLWAPQEPILIKGNCIISYESGFEQAKREPSMKDWYQDASTATRHERRRRAALVEGHVKHYFATQYQEFFRPPSNDGRYDRSSPEDFFLGLPTICLSVDVKSWSYDRDDESKQSPHGLIRAPDSKTVYLWADWQDDETTAMWGICSGGWAQMVGHQGETQLAIEPRHIQPMDIFLVILNMAKSGMNYIDFRRALLTERVAA